MDVFAITQAKLNTARLGTVRLNVTTTKITISHFIDDSTTFDDTLGSD
jgi:hypothetical protein